MDAALVLEEKSLAAAGQFQGLVSDSLPGGMNRIEQAEIQMDSTPELPQRAGARSERGQWSPGV